MHESERTPIGSGNVTLPTAGRTGTFSTSSDARGGDPRYLALLDEMKELHRKKAAGYAGQDNPDAWTNFREAENWGSTALQGCLIRLGDKFRRLQNITRDAGNEQLGESWRDTAVDLAAYALIAVCLAEEEQGKPLSAATEPQPLCTYRGCGRPENDRAIHPADDQRMGLGMHVFRAEP